MTRVSGVMTCSGSNRGPHAVPATNDATTKSMNTTNDRTRRMGYLTRQEIPPVTPAGLYVNTADESATARPK